jgi:putative peptidoglycan lipid II flippase
LKKNVFSHISRGSVATFFGVSALTFLAKMGIVAKELVVAGRYGRRDEVDAFLIAFLVPSFIVSILGNAMTTAFLPVYVQVREKEGKEAAQGLLAGMSFLTICALGVTALLLLLSAPLFLPLIASGFNEQKLIFTRHMLYWLTPYLVMSGLLSVWYAVINSQENFVGVVLPPVLTPLLMIALLLLVPSAGIYALVYGSLGGALLEMLVTGSLLWRAGISLRPRLRAISRSLRRVAGQFLPALMGALLMNSTLLVDQAMAAKLDPGSVAAISYGNKVIGFVLTILATTFSILLTPFFSKKMIGTNGRDALKPLGQFLSGVFAIACVLPLLIQIFSFPLAKLIFYRGAFSLTDVKLIAGIQSLLAWQIPFYLCGVILVKFIASLQLNWIQAVVAGCNVVVNVVMNYWLMQRMGVKGIALSTSIVHMCSLLLLGLLVVVAIKGPGLPAERQNDILKQKG